MGDVFVARSLQKSDDALALNKDSVVSLRPACVLTDLPVFWTEASRRGLSLHDVSRLMSHKTAQLASLHGRKGTLRPGMDADFVVWDPDAQWVITPEDILFKNKVWCFRSVQNRVKMSRLASDRYGS